MRKVLIWGIGKGYNSHFNLIRGFENSGSIKVIGVFSDDMNIKSIDGYPFFSKREIHNLQYDYCIVTIGAFSKCFEEMQSLGIERNKIIPVRVLDVPGIDIDDYFNLKENGITILSQNCFAGVLYHYLALEFQSPTINLWMTDIDFNKFLKELDYYISQPVNLVGYGYNPVLDIQYPIGTIDDIIINFNHYSSFDVAVNSWEKRKRRIKDNMAIISYSDNSAVVDDFCSLDYQNKLIFVPKNYRMSNDSDNILSVDYSESENMSLGEYINRAAVGELNIFNPFAFLCRKEFHRIK